MKLNKWLLGPLAVTLMVSCSEDRNRDVIQPDNGSVGSKGYIGISIGIPSENITRGQNDSFDDGLESEYTVSGAAILFFTGEESNPDFYKAYKINESEWESNPDNPNQITQSNVVSFPVDFAKNSSGELWALAVINPGSVMSVGSDNTLTINGEEFTGTFKDLMKLTTDKSLSGAGSFFMTNVPYATVPGTTSTVEPSPNNPKFHVLARVNQDNIKPTLQEAKANPAAEIFVERAVAKVEVVSTSLTLGGGIKFPNDFHPEFNNVTDVSWVLDNLEPTSYIVRNLDEQHDNTKVPYWALYDTNTTQSSLTHHYRFIGNTPFRNFLARYRTYFGVDPNGVGIEEGKNLVSALTGDFKEPGNDKPQYCKENTFDVAHMDYRNTTRAVIKVNLGGNNSGNIYTVGEDKKNVYYFADAASYLAQGVLYDEDVVKAWTDYFMTLNQTYENNATINDLEYIRETRTAQNKWMKIKFNVNTKAGRLQIDSVELLEGNGSAINTYESSDATAARVNQNVTVKCYENGVTYYSVLIRHFGNDLAPWTSVDLTTNTTTDSYGKTGGQIGLQDEMNYLGRYGVLRNNWYVINLGTINNMGEPVVGDLPLDGTPDDRVVKEESITCRINILSWAKRNQTADF